MADEGIKEGGLKVWRTSTSIYIQRDDGRAEVGRTAVKGGKGVQSGRLTNRPCTHGLACGNPCDAKRGRERVPTTIGGGAAAYVECRENLSWS